MSEPLTPDAAPPPEPPPAPPAGLPAPPPVTDWQRLDRRMLLVHPVTELIRFLPVLIGLFVASSATDRGDGLQLLAIVIPVLIGLVRYWTTRYRISGDRIELERGLLSRHAVATPLDRVRTVDITASPVHRVLRLATVRIGTGSAGGDGLDLDGLPAERARELRARLLHSIAAPPPSDPDAPPSRASGRSRASGWSPASSGAGCAMRRSPPRGWCSVRVSSGWAARCSTGSGSSRDSTAGRSTSS